MKLGGTSEVHKLHMETQAAALNLQQDSHHAALLNKELIVTIVTTIEFLISKIISKASASRVYVCLWTITSTS